MKKNLIFLISSLLIYTQTLPTFDTSPWVIVRNETKFDMACILEAAYYCNENDQSNKAISVDLSNNKNVTVQFNPERDEHKKKYMKIMINFDCNKESLTTFNAIFYEDNQVFNPKIKSISFTNDSLQLKTFCDPIDAQQRYFSIAYHLDYGFTTKAQPIAMYIKCLNQLKHTMRAIIFAALYATDWLPY